MYIVSLLSLISRDFLEVLQVLLLLLKERGDEGALGHAAVARHRVLVTLGVQQLQAEAVLPAVTRALLHAQLPAHDLVLLASGT